MAWSADSSMLAPHIQATFEDQEHSEILVAGPSTSSLPFERHDVEEEIEKSRPYWSEVRDRSEAIANLTPMRSETNYEDCQESTLCDAIANLTPMRSETNHEDCQESTLWSRITQCFRETTVTRIYQHIFQDREKNRQVTELLLDHNIRLGDHGKDLVLGNLIAKGGQAEIYDAEWTNKSGQRDGTKSGLVFKVFKKTFDLRRECPLQMLRRGNQGHFTAMCHGATVLRDGRFAFVFDRYWGSLDRLLRKRLEHKRREQNSSDPPFVMIDAVRVMLEIARGMRNLHMKGLLHRDLKSANILVDCREGDDIVSETRPLISCNITDYESSNEVLGTRFWRSPEVLRYVIGTRAGHAMDRDSAFTEKADVYSYAMTSYEVLTGGIPFGDIPQSDYDVILKQEKRPDLPDHVHPSIKALLERCWHADPRQRPAFHEIEDEIIRNSF